MAYPYDYGWEKESRFSLENQLGKVFRRGGPAGSGIVSAFDFLKLSNAMHAGRIVKPETFSPSFQPEA